MVEDAPIEGAMAVLSMPATEVDEALVTLADGLAGASARFVQAAEAVAAGVGEDQAIAILLLEVADVLAMGARLGALDPPPGRRIFSAQSSRHSGCRPALSCVGSWVIKPRLDFRGYRP